MFRRARGRRSIASRLQQRVPLSLALTEDDFEITCVYGHIVGLAHAATGRWEVNEVNARGNWGGVLYQTALEVATRHGTGLMSDRYMVSRRARAVWDKFALRAAQGDGVARTQLHPGPDAAEVIREELVVEEGEEDALDDLLAYVQRCARPDGVDMVSAVYASGWAAGDFRAWRTSPIAYLYRATAFPVHESGLLQPYRRGA